MNILGACDRILGSGRNAALATIIEASDGTPGKQGFKLVLADDGELSGTVGGGALENRVIEEAKGILASGKSRVFHFNMADLGMECGGAATVVIEYLQAAKPFMLFGGGHIGRALCPILQSIGFTVSVFDPRPDAAAYFDGGAVSVIREEYAQLANHADEIRRADYCIIATHGHEHDYQVLRDLILLNRDFKYVGLIGSKRKIQVTVKKLTDEDVKVPPFVYTPIGIKIGALTAAEIAVSIVAEVIAVKNGYEADHMRTAAP